MSFPHISETFPIIEMMAAQTTRMVHRVCGSRKSSTKVVRISPRVTIRLLANAASGTLIVLPDSNERLANAMIWTGGFHPVPG
jgi:hypothetical protein